MNNNDILNKYIDLIDKGYCCACNELNCIDNFPHAKITHAIRELQQENKQLKDNQVRAMNKIRDFIDNANCEIKESKYSNDKHGLYWELFRKDLTNIQKLIKGINTDEYVNIPKYREKELLNLENNWNKLKEYLNYQSERAVGEDEYVYDEIYNEIQELEQGSDNQ